MHWPVKIRLEFRPLDSCIIQHWRIKPWHGSSAAGPWDKNRQAETGSCFSIISWNWKGWEESLPLMENAFFLDVSGVATGNGMAIELTKNEGQTKSFPKTFYCSRPKYFFKDWKILIVPCLYAGVFHQEQGTPFISVTGSSGPDTVIDSCRSYLLPQPYAVPLFSDIQLKSFFQ